MVDIAQPIWLDARVMTLDKWLTNQEMNAEAFGRLIGVTGQAVRRYRSGERMPDAKTVSRILERTGGQVTGSEMHETHMLWFKQHGVIDRRSAEASAA